MADEQLPAPAERTPDTQVVPDAGRGDPEPRWLTGAILVGIAVFLYLVHSILAPFVIAAILAYILSPVVAWIEAKTRVRRGFAVAGFMLAVLVPFGILIWVVEPPLARETNELVKDSPTIISNLMVQVYGTERIEVFGQVVDARAINAYIERGITDTVGEPRGAIHAAAVVVETILKSFLALILLVYFLMNPRPFGEIVLRIFPPGGRDGVKSVGAEIHSVLGRYVRGLSFLVALMASATWIGLSLVFHVPYSLPIAITTGFLEIIPFLGPVAAGAIACAVALSAGGPHLALGVAIFYLVLRQLEDQLVMPVVIGHAIEVHPAVNIFAVLAGTALWGILGALLAIPVAAAIKVAFLHFRPE